MSHLHHFIAWAKLHPGVLRNDAFWVLCHAANVIIWVALVKRWRTIRAIAFIELCSLPIIAFQDWNFFHTPVIECWLSRWENADVLQGTLLIPLIWCLSKHETKGPAMMLPVLYFGVIGTMMYEYSLVDDGLKALANTIYFRRLYLQTFTAFVMAFSLYIGAIGNPDKERYERARA